MNQLEVITLEEFKANSRIEGSEEDAVLERLAMAAESMVFRAIRRPWYEVESAYGGIPPEVRQAVLMVADHLYANRGETSGVQQYRLPLGVRDMLSPFIKLF